LLQRDLDQQIDDLKAWQKLDLQECYKVSGSDSDACRQLKDRHAQDLHSFRDDRAYQMANCRGSQPHTVVAASPFENSNHDLNDFYEKYYSNRGPCVEYPYVNCQNYDHYVHARLHHHHHHYYADPPSGNGKATSAYVEKHGNADKSAESASEYVEKRGKADKSARQDTAPTRSSAHDTPARSAHRGSDRDNSFNHSSGHDNSPTHNAGRSDSASTATSHHNHDSGGASYSGASHTSGSGSSHASGASSDSHASSAGSSSSAASHSSGGGGSAAGSGASAPSPASSPSHDTGGARPK